jgi:uncharacterized protein (DUF2126 family)
MQVTRIHESPRVTKPYTEEQWAEVLALGAAVDRELQAGDVRLTMGGEPTFVAVSTATPPNGTPTRSAPPSAATPPALVHKLRDEYGQGGFLHFGPGQVVPGGSRLPRWAAVDLLARRRLSPGLAQSPLVRRRAPGPPQHTNEDAQRFVRRLAGRLGLHQRTPSVPPLPWTASTSCGASASLPVNVDPFDSRLDDEHERSRLRLVFGQKLDAVVATPLPPASFGEGRRPALLARRDGHRPLFFRDGACT